MLRPLLLFNVGVEIGQLAFVALVLLLARAFKVLQVHWPRRGELAPAHEDGLPGHALPGLPVEQRVAVALHLPGSPPALLLAACGDKKPGQASQTAVKVNDGEITVHQINFVLQQQRGLKPDTTRASKGRTNSR